MLASGVLARRQAGLQLRQLATSAAAAPAAADPAASASSPERLGALPLAFPTVCIWGSNTGVGKTLFSAGLAAACRRAGLSVLYLKPVQTGFPQDSDARLVAAAAGLPLAAGPHAAALGDASTGAAAAGPSSAAQLSKTLYAWGQPVSPHLAVATQGRPVGDGQLAAAVAAELRGFAAAGGGSQGLPQIGIVETAGGVASPGPSGTPQCDLLRGLRLPGVLVGDGRLGGISATLSAYDSLALRGHQVPLVALMDDGRCANTAAIQQQLRGKAHVLAFPVCAPPPAGAAAPPPGGVDASLAAWLEASRPQFDQLLALAREAHEARLAQLHGAAGDAARMLWWPFTQHASVGGVTVIDGRVGEHFAVFRPAPQAAGAAAGAADAASAAPATEGSASGGSGGAQGAVPPGDSLHLLYDACASWWTQGVNAAAQPELVRAVSAAAARYGHVMFPENAHEPAVELARALLGGVGAGWAARVFYSDDGSTAVEVALKMAFRKWLADAGLIDPREPRQQAVNLQVVGLTEAYHGDTLGAMDAVAPSPFNGGLQTPWYQGRGLFLDPPTVALAGGAWRVELPDSRGWEHAQEHLLGAHTRESSFASTHSSVPPLAQPKPFPTTFASQADVFALERRMPRGGEQAEGGGAASLYALYRCYVQFSMGEHDVHYGFNIGRPNWRDEEERQEREEQAWEKAARLAACIIEPVLQGAGGMRLIDPLFQRALVDECRERGIPVIYDEVFTGLWRLGAPSGAALLGAAPDIACYAKLLTGGTVPLAATLASEAVFDAFKGDSKVEALLHGHSYSAHPIGCAAGVSALRLYQDPSLNPNWCTPEVPGRCRRQAEQQAEQQGGGSDGDGGEPGGAACCEGPCGRLLPLWDEAAVAELSRHPRVASVMPMGTVLAARLRRGYGAGRGGYGSDAAAVVVRRLHKRGVYARPLGDVVYLMVTPMTERAQCDALLGALTAALDGGGGAAGDDDEWRSYGWV